MYTTVFFDMDGTIADSSEGIIKSVAYALNKFGVKVKDTESLKKFIGPPIKYSFMHFYGFSELQAYTAIEYYRERYEETGVYETILYDGIVDIIKSLKARGVKIAVASSKPTHYINKIFEKFGIDGLFDFISGSEFDGTRSEKTEVIEHAIEVLNITDRKDILMVGDRYFDIEGANTTGIASVGVLYGFGTREELQEHSPVAILETVADLDKFLKKNT